MAKKNRHKDPEDLSRAAQARLRRRRERLDQPKATIKVKKSTTCHW